MPSSQEVITSSSVTTTQESISEQTESGPADLLFTDLFECLRLDFITFDYDGDPPCFRETDGPSSSQETLTSGSI